MSDKKVVFDEKIEPLVRTLVGLCEKYQIPFIANFALSDGDRHFVIVADENDEVPTSFLRAAKEMGVSYE